MKNQNNKKLEKESEFSILARFISGNGPWTVKTIKSASFWIKIVLGIVLGTIFGAFRITGMVGNLIYLGVAMFGVQLYITNVLQLNALIQGQNIQMEGFMQGFAAFMLTWGIVYTAMMHNSQ